MTSLDEVLADLAIESAALDDLVAALDDDGWHLPTPATGWTIAHQISHLAWTDRQAIRAATEPDGFRAELATAWRDPAAFVQAGADEGAAEPPADLLGRWRAGRTRLPGALRAAPARLPWFGVEMSPTSMATGRFMETWAHGLDVAAALGRRPKPTPRMAHVAFLGVRARPMGFRARGLPVPAVEPRVELAAPDGTTWLAGPADSPERVTGPLLDFCLLVTQRIHRTDTALRAVGPGADAWLDVAQAFAGPAGAGRAPRGA